MHNDLTVPMNSIIFFLHIIIMSCGDECVPGTQEGLDDGMKKKWMIDMSCIYFQYLIMIIIY